MMRNRSYTPAELDAKTERMTRGMATVIAETTRGGIPESIHHGVVVAVDAAFREAILERHSPELRNHNGRLVGEIRPIFQLSPAVAVA